VSSIYGFWQGPTYRPSTRDELFGAALEQPMSLGATFWDQAKGGVLESFGLGTTIREMTLPPSAPGRWYGDTDQSYADRRKDYKTITEEEYKASPYFRDNVPWDNGMTEDRAAALATMNDAKRVRQYFAEKRPITSFFGNLAGQATDPINYIPVAGPTVKAAAVARMGVVKGIAATAALDAAANTAIAGLATRETRRSFGDDVSWQMMVSEIATAALLGTAFGTVGGVLQRRAGLRADALRSEAEVKVNTLRATQEARIALNEAIGGLANDGEVRLSPNGVAPIERVANEVEGPALRDVPVLPTEEDVTIAGSDIFNEPPQFRSLRDDPDARGVTTDLSAVKVKDEIFTGETHDEAVRSAIARFDEPTVEKAIDADPEGALGHVERRPVLLPHDSSLNRTASWVIRDKATKTAVMETFNPKLAERVNTAKYEAVPIGQYLGEINGQPKRAVDASPARPEPPPAGRAEAEAKVAKPENYKALADQYRVDPEAGTFPEEAELRQLAQAGRLSDVDMAVLDDADAAFQDGAAYGKALESVVNCLV